MKFKSLEDIEEAGFTGFKTVAQLQNAGCSAIPESGGVYMILRAENIKPQFLAKGTGGYYREKNPNVAIAELQSNWVEDTVCVYIGKATTLNKRINLYMRFGAGANVGHYGGRYIWQLADSKSLIVCWKRTKEDPREVESALIEEFREQYGARPFANLVD